MSFRCSACGTEGDVTNSRKRDDGCVYRTRVCQRCHKHWQTVEVRLEDRIDRSHESFYMAVKELVAKMPK